MEIQSRISYHFRDDQGALASLRPFSGKLQRHLFDEVLAAAKKLAEGARPTPSRERYEELEHLQLLAKYVRRWALEHNGMLQRNSLLEADDREYLAQWTEEAEDYLSLAMERLGDELFPMRRHE